MTVWECQFSVRKRCYFVIQRRAWAQIKANNFLYRSTVENILIWVCFRYDKLMFFKFVPLSVIDKVGFGDWTTTKIKNLLWHDCLKFNYENFEKKIDQIRCFLPEIVKIYCVETVCCRKWSDENDRKTLPFCSCGIISCSQNKNIAFRAKMRKIR